MNCPNCNATLPENARFCATCGKTITASRVAIPQPDVAEMGTLIMSKEVPQTPAPVGPPSGQRLAGQQASGPYFSTAQPGTGDGPAAGQREPITHIPARQAGAGQKKIRKYRHLIWGTGIPVALLLILVGSWFLGLRPYLHSMAEEQLGNVMSKAMNDINPLATMLIPPGVPLPVPGNLINNALNQPRETSWYTIQNITLSITQENISVQVQVQVGPFNFTCTVTTVPEIVNGEARVKSMSVDGPIALVMTADEMQAEVNSYLDQLHTQINRPIQALTLEDGYLLVTMG